MNLVCYARSYLKEGDTVELKVKASDAHSLSFKILKFIFNRLDLKIRKNLL